MTGSKDRSAELHAQRSAAEETTNRTLASGPQEGIAKQAKRLLYKARRDDHPPSHLQSKPQNVLSS